MLVKKPKRQDLSDVFFGTLRYLAREDNSFDGYEREYRFYSKRRWRLDFAWPEEMVAVECDGGQWKSGGGRHNTDADREKLNTAASMGWLVLRLSGKAIRDDVDSWRKLLLQALQLRKKSL